MSLMRWVPFWPRTSALSGESVNTLFIAELILCAAILILVLFPAITAQAAGPR